MPLVETKSMLERVRGLINEAKTRKDAHKRHQRPAYMKLVMLEQALTDHYGDLRIQHKIMLENEEVQKSQVILAAQDMVDNIQKMVEQISKMKVEELNAVVTGVKNEFGTNEGQQFESTAIEALTTLEGALTAAKSGLSGALGQITGEGADSMGDDTFGDETVPGMDDGGSGDMSPGDDISSLPEPDTETDFEEPEEELGGAGRERR